MTSLVIATRDGIADAGQEEDLARLRKSLSHPNAKVLVHFHGGLVDESSGREAAKRLSGQGANSWNLGDDWTQLYLVWRTDAFETLRTNWKDLAENDRLYQIVLSKLLNFAARSMTVPAKPGVGERSARDLLGIGEREIRSRISGTAGQDFRQNPFPELDRSIGIGVPEQSRALVPAQAQPSDLAKSFKSELEMDPDFESVIRDLTAAINGDAAGRSALVSGDAVVGRESLKRLSSVIQRKIASSDDATQSGGRGVVSISIFILERVAELAFRVFTRFRSSRDHGFHATVVEEVCREFYGDLVGATIWRMIKGDAAQHFKAGGFGLTLLDTLRTAARPVRIAITAHSAGAILASHMLLKCKESNIFLNPDVFFLAPAVRCSLFSEVVKEIGSGIRDFRMFTMKDEYERKDPVLGANLSFIYPSSLLYCVSGMFEEQADKH